MMMQAELEDSEGGVGCVEVERALTVVGTARVVVDAKSKHTNGPLRPAELRIRVSGGGLESVMLGVVHDVPSFLISPQATGPFTAICEENIQAQGVVWIPARRPDPPAVQVVVNNDGSEPLVLVQDTDPLSLTDWTPAMERAVARADVLVAAARPCDTGTYTLLDALPGACDGLRVLVPDRSLICMPDFPDLARKYDYVVMTDADARLLPGAGDDCAKNALRLRYLLGGHKECTVVNQHGDGWHWDGAAWTRIDATTFTRGVWFPEVFATAYSVGTVFLNFATWHAVQYARQSTIYASLDGPPDEALA